MTLVAIFVVVGLVVALAAVVVIREAGRLGGDPPGALFDLTDAVEWVAQRLPDDVAATLTVDDVARILELGLELVGGTEVATNGSSAPIVLGDDRSVELIVGRSGAGGEEYLPEQVRPVLVETLEYLRAIGAIGPAADDPE